MAFQHLGPNGPPGTLHNFFRRFRVKLLGFQWALVTDMKERFYATWPKMKLIGATGCAYVFKASELYTAI
jgi:hypothetical protein